MKNILALLGAAVVAFAGAGWYLGWYEIESLPSPNGKQRLSVEVNSKKIISDVQKGVEKGSEIIGSLAADKNKENKPNALPIPQGPANSFFSPSK